MNKRIRSKKKRRTNERKKEEPIETKILKWKQKRRQNVELTAEKFPKNTTTQSEETNTNKKGKNFQDKEKKRKELRNK